MADPAVELSGAQRAAIFLLGVGEAGAAAVMKHLAPNEVQRVGEAMANLQEVSNEQIATVVQDFSERVSNTNPIAIGAGDFTRRVMEVALGENRARSMLNKVMQGTTTKGIDALKWMDARSVAGMIHGEHPQIVALVLASLDADHAAKIMAFLPAEMQSEVLVRIGRLNLIDPEALLELDHVLETQLGKGQQSPPSSVDGLHAAAAILNNMEASPDNDLLEAVKKVDGELGEKIHELMFVFEDLLLIDDRGMQRLMREISGDKLIVALKGVGEKLKNKFLSNMSSRAAEMLVEDLEAKGPVKLSEVEAEQKEILAIAARLAADGEIFLGGGGGDFV